MCVEVMLDKKSYYSNVLEICKLQSSYMFKVALATTVCYDKKLY
jgi:hypothetical protein